MDTSRDEARDRTERIRPPRGDETVVMHPPFRPESTAETLIGRPSQSPVLALARLNQTIGGAADDQTDAGATQFIGSPYSPAADAATVAPSRGPRKRYLLAGALVTLGLGLLAVRGFGLSQTELAESPAPIEVEADQSVLAAAPIEPGVPTVARFDLGSAPTEPVALGEQTLGLATGLATDADRSPIDPRGEAALVALGQAEREAELLGQRTLLTPPTEGAPTEAVAEAESAEPAEPVAEASTPSDEQVDQAGPQLANQAAALEAASEAEPVVEQAVASRNDDEDDDEDGGRNAGAALTELRPAAEQAAGRMGFGR